VLDVVRHHGDYISDELGAETGWRIAAKDRLVESDALAGANFLSLIKELSICCVA
jgi:hypothetical protein